LKKRPLSKSHIFVNTLKTCQRWQFSIVIHEPCRAAREILSTHHRSRFGRHLQKIYIYIYIYIYKIDRHSSTSESVGTYRQSWVKCIYIRVCVYICMYIYKQTYICIYVCILMYIIYICMYSWVKCVYIRVCVYICMYTNTYTYICIYVCILMYITYICMYTYIYIFKYIYVCIYVQITWARNTVCYSVLQCVAVCCNVLQCVAVCCSMLQCVAMCCSMYIQTTWVRNTDYFGGEASVNQLNNEWKNWMVYLNLTKSSKCHELDTHRAWVTWFLGAKDYFQMHLQKYGTKVVYICVYVRVCVCLSTHQCSRIRRHMQTQKTK